MNETSFLARLILHILGANHPIRLASGIALGVIAKMTITATAAAIGHPSLLNLANYETWWYMLAVAPLLYLPLLAGKKGAPEPVVHQINTVQALLDRSGLSRERQRLIWNALVTKYIEHARPDFSQTPDLERLAKSELAREGTDSPAG